MKEDRKDCTSILPHSLLAEVSLRGSQSSVRVEQHHDPPRQPIGSCTSSLPCFERCRSSVLQPIKPRPATSKTSKAHRSTKPVAVAVKNVPSRPSVTRGTHSRAPNQSQVLEKKRSAETARPSYSRVIRPSQAKLSKPKSKNADRTSLPIKPARCCVETQTVDENSLSAGSGVQERVMSVAELSEYLQSIIQSAQSTLNPATLLHASSQTSGSHGQSSPSSGPVIPSTGGQENETRTSYGAEKKKKDATKGPLHEVADVEALVSWPWLDSSPLQLDDGGDVVVGLGVRRLLRDSSDVLRTARAWLEQHPPTTAHTASSRVQPSTRTSSTRSQASLSSSKARPPAGTEARSGEQGSRHRPRSHLESSGRHNEMRSHATAASSRGDTSHRPHPTKKVVFQNINQQRHSVTSKQMKAVSPPDIRSSLSSSSPCLADTLVPLPAPPSTNDSRPSTSIIIESHEQSQVDTPRLHTHTLQPITIRRSLVHQSGPQVGISPHPLQIRSSNVLVELQSAAETEPTSPVCSNLTETAVQTSPERTLNYHQQVPIDLPSIPASKVVLETATQTSSSLQSVLHTAVQTESIGVVLASSIAADPQTVSKVHQSTKIYLPVITVAVQTDELFKKDAATEIFQLSLTDDQITSDDPLQAAQKNESQFGPDGDVPTSQSPQLSTSPTTVSMPDKILSRQSIVTAVNNIIPQSSVHNPEDAITSTNTELTPANIAEKQFTKPSNISPRILSPIMEQSSPFENSPLEVMSPVVVADRELLNVDLVPTAALSQHADTLGSTSDRGEVLQHNGMLLLLSLNSRDFYVKGSHIHQISEQTDAAVLQHDQSSTLSSLAESNQSSADISDSSSPSNVEGAGPGSEGELLPGHNDVTVSSGDVINEPDDVLGSVDTLSEESSAPASRAEWSRSSCSVGEACTIPAAQRRRVLYFASRVAPQLLANSAGSRSEGELSEGQVWPWPPQDLPLSCSQHSKQASTVQH